MNTIEKVKQWFIDRDLENGGRLDKQSFEIIMDYEWKQMQEQATFIKANTRKWRARCN